MGAASLPSKPKPEFRIARKTLHAVVLSSPFRNCDRMLSCNSGSIIGIDI
jgi:hypothetical protein